MAAKRDDRAEPRVRAARAGGHRARAVRGHRPAPRPRRRPPPPPTAATRPADRPPPTRRPPRPHPRPPRRASPCRPRSAARRPAARGAGRASRLPGWSSGASGCCSRCSCCCSRIAALRATWLGTVGSGSLSERAVSQQIENVDDPAQRGTIYDRNGVELAVSEDSTTVFANPFLIKDPAQGGRAARSAHGHEGGRAAAEAVRPEHRLRLPAPQDGRRPPARRSAKLEDRGDRHDRRSRSGSTRRATWRRRCWGWSAPTTTGSRGSSTPMTRRSAGTTASAGSSRTRSARP